MTVKTAADRRTLHLSAYVDLSLEDALEAFNRPEIDDVLQSAIQAALGPSGEPTTVHVSIPERVSVRSARVSASWCTAAVTGDGREGSATILFLTVQSGHDPLTELLVILPVGEAIAAPAAVVTRRFLDELTARLVAVPS